MSYQLYNPDISSFQQKYQVDALIAKIIMSKNLTDSQIEQVLNPSLSLSENNAKCVEEACKRILKAKENKEKVFVGGDYDADGICATAIAKRMLDKLGIENGFYIPDRFKEGYGLNEQTVQLAYDKGYSLIITVDNGVKASQALKKAKQLGIDVIVTDHHIIEGDVDCLVLVHHSLMDEVFSTMCGAATIFQVSRKLIGEDDLSLCLSAVATVGDVMPLWNENRTIVRLGLKKIKQCPSIISLIDTRNVEPTVTDLAFSIVPKLNAIGRMKDLSNPNNVVKYLLLEDNEQIKQLSLQINNINNQRKQLSSSMSNEAFNKIDNNQPLLIIEDDSFHEGIIGLVAGKISNQIKKPCIIFSKVEQTYKGSGRSYGDFDMYNFFAHDFDYLLTFGGHSQAVGLSINQDKMDTFISQVNQKMQGIKINEATDTDIVIQLDHNDLTVDNIKSLSTLEPFGQGFALPLFGVKPTRVTKFQMLKGIYPKYELDVEGINMEAICFQTSNLKIEKEPKVLIGTISINEFRGNATLSMTIKDME